MLELFKSGLANISWVDTRFQVRKQLEGAVLSMIWRIGQEDWKSGVVDLAKDFD